MPVTAPPTSEVAAQLRVSIGLLVRRLRQTQTPGELTLSEISALARLDRGGPATSSGLARLEQISPQSMGATIATLEQRGLVARTADPTDGRRILLSVSPAGVEFLRHRRAERTEHLAAALSDGFTPAEIRRLAEAAPLLERLAAQL